MAELALAADIAYGVAAIILIWRHQRSANALNNQRNNVASRWRVMWRRHQ